MKRTPLKRKKPLNRVSKKRAVQNREYARLRREFLAEHPFCQIMHVLSLKFIESTEIHHKKGREGTMLNDTEFWMAVSRRGHEIIHNSPEFSYKMGWLLRK